MKNILATATVAAALTSGAFALTASDNSTNYSGVWTNGSDLGTGFGAWNLSATGSGGRYIGGTGLGASSFGIFAGGGAGNSSTANRPFDTAMAIGDIFTVRIGYTSVTNAGEIGMNLFATNSFRFGLKFTGGGTNWQLNDGGSWFNTGIPWAGGSPGTTLNVSFTRRAGNSYDIVLGQGANNYTGTNFTATSGFMDVDRVQFYSSAQGSGQNVGFDNLSVVPEPSTYALLGLGALALGGYAARRRRR